MENQGTYAFTANSAGSEEADEVFTVGVAEEFGQYFMIQRPLGCDEVKPEELYTEIGDQVNGGYGTLEFLTVGRNRLIAQLRGGRRVEATLEISDESFAALEEDLRRCFSGLENLLCLAP